MARLKKSQPSKKNNHDKLLWHTKTAVSDVEQPTQHHKHVCVSTQADGRLDLSTSYLATTSSESADASSKPIIEPQLQDGMSDQDSLEKSEFLDPEYIRHLAEMSLDPNSKGTRQRLPGDEALHMWLLHVDTFLEEMICIEGRGQDRLGQCRCSKNSVSVEPDSPAEFECVDCVGRELKCHGCIVQAHADSPFHRIKRWNGTFFESVSLKALGLRLQLGHPPGTKCVNPVSCPGDEFVVIDTNGVHEIGLDFCSCGFSSQSRTVQLLRSRLYPATVQTPKTAATFRTLECFELLSYVSKVSIFEYYQSLARLTDNTGMFTPKDCYVSLKRMVREWRYLKLLKRSGRGHDPLGARATQPGECAILCPACPQPGKNLVPGWENAPEETRWLYALFLGIDANFRLKRKNVSNDKADPDLNQGCAYFVEEKEYKEYLEVHEADSVPKSVCSRHDAVNLAGKHSQKDYAASGTGTIECARHNMKRPNAVGDLQKGERYCNMDYLFYKSLYLSTLIMLVISYDIVCQWSINFRQRMSQFSDWFDAFDSRVQLTYLVPKFHIPAHVLACQTGFSFNLTKGVGRTDGEAPERGWAEVNPLAASTKEMGPGSRRDTLDAHFGFYNWKKFTGMGLTLLRKMKAAVDDMYDHVIAHEELHQSLPHAAVAQWADEVERWEKDSSQPNPYVITVEVPSQAAIRRQLSEIEAKELLEGRDIALDDDVSPSVLIAFGIDLEAEQRALKVEIGKVWLHSQDRQLTRVQLRSNALQRKINAWITKQQLYIPGVVALRKVVDAAGAPDGPQNYPLWLPSQIGTQVAFNVRLAELEWEMRYSQAHDALNSLRKYLQMRAHLYKFKDRFIRGQSANTRARNAIATVQARIDASGDEYRVAHAALWSLGPLLGKIGWQTKFLPLTDADKRELTEVEPGVSEGTRKLSWIWKTTNVTGNVVDMETNEELRDSLRVEWCKSRARAMRFREEVELLTEEMSRVLRFLTWQEQWWKAKGQLDMRRLVTVANAEGLHAYAERQAALRCSLRAHFSRMWSNIPQYVQITTAAMAEAIERISGQAGEVSH